MAKLSLTEDWADFTKGAYPAVNNPWGKGGLVNGQDYTQSITVETTTFPDDTLLTWDWGDRFNSSIYAYPEVIFGYKAWDPGEGTLAYSSRVGALKSLEAKFDLGISGKTQNFNVAIETWLTDVRGGGSDAITTEVMIWLHNGSLTPAGEKVGRFVSPTYKADIYVQDNMGGGDGWRYIALAPDSDYLAGTIDIRAVLHALRKLGFVDVNDWVSGFELGAEVAGGNGSLKIDSLDHAFARYAVTAGADHLIGTAKPDYISALAGNDRLEGRQGNDELRGGAGKDSFAFNTAPHSSTNFDRIIDFAPVDDTIRLEDSVFRAVDGIGAGGRGRLLGDQFFRGPAANDREDRIIYNPATGVLFYDADGTDPIAAIRFALIGKGLTVTAADFLVV